MPIRLTTLTVLEACIRERAAHATRPFIVAVDGRSGAGKSTLAGVLAELLDAAVIDGDDFYAGGTRLREDDVAQRAAACIDWTRQRAVLDALRAGRDGVWRAFDWDAFDGSLCVQPTVLAPSRVVILEGVYAARPELAALVDLTVLVTIEDGPRLARLLAREGHIGPWERQWHEAERHYFEHVMPARAFDVIVDGGASEQRAAT